MQILFFYILYIFYLFIYFIIFCFLKFFLMQIFHWRGKFKRFLFQFIVNPGPMSQNVKIPLNICIGNVPLRQHFVTLENPSVAGSQLQNPLVDLPVHVFPSDQYPDLRNWRWQV